MTLCECAVIVNLDELIIQPHILTSLVGIYTESSSQLLTQSPHPQTSDKIHVPKQHKHGGSFPSLVSKFPNITDVVTKFIKQNGYQAHAHRCTETTNIMWGHPSWNSTEFIWKILKLRKHSVGKTTIAYLLAPPHKGRCSAARYRSLLDVRWQGKWIVTENVFLISTTFLSVFYPEKLNRAGGIGGKGGTKYPYLYVGLGAFSPRILLDFRLSEIEYDACFKHHCKNACGNNFTDEFA